MPGEDYQSWSTSATLNGNADSGINWAEGQPRASVNNSSRAQMAAHAKNRNLTNGSIVTSGTANAQTFFSGVGYTAVPTGLRVLLKIGPELTNGAGGTTLNMDSIGAVAIKNQLGVDIAAKDLTAGGYAEFVYEGTNWILLFSIPAVSQPPAVVPVGPPVIIPPGTPAPSADFITGITDAYDTYIFEGVGIAPVDDARGMCVRFSQDAGATWKAGAADYMWTMHLTDAAGNHSTLGNPGVDLMLMTTQVLSNVAGMNFSFRMRLNWPASTTLRKTMIYEGVSTHPAGSLLAWWAGAGAFGLNLAAINGVRFFMFPSGNIASGTFRMSASGPTGL